MKNSCQKGNEQGVCGSPQGDRPAALIQLIMAMCKRTVWSFKILNHKMMHITSKRAPANLPMHKDTASALQAFVDEGIAGGEVLDYICIFNVDHVENVMLMPFE